MTNNIHTKIMILAAGKGTRMKSDLAKVLHPINGKPMIVQVLETVKKTDPAEIYLIVGHQADKVEEETKSFNPIYVEQIEQLGTGHAIMMVEDKLTNQEGLSIITCGDVPLLRAETIENLKKTHTNQGVSATIITAVLDDAKQYGRIIRNEDNLVEKIVEFKDATDEERACNEINSGIYCFNTADLFDAIKRISNNNAQQEYYLTDVIEILKKDNKKVGAYIIENNDEIQGINTIDDLKEAEQTLLKA